MISAVRQLLKNDTNERVWKRILCLPPLCASQFVRDGTVAVTQELQRREGCVARKHTEQCDFLLDFLEQAAGIAGANKLSGQHLALAISRSALMVVRLTVLWDDTGEALKEIGLEIGQSKSCYTKQEKTEWDHKTLSFKKKIVISGTEAPEWNSTAADEGDASLAQARLEEACEFAGNVKAITQLHIDLRKTEEL